MNLDTVTSLSQNLKDLPAREEPEKGAKSAEELLESSTQGSDQGSVQPAAEQQQPLAQPATTRFVDLSLYSQLLEPQGFATVPELPDPQHNERCQSANVQRQKRIQTEVRLMQKNLPVYASNAIFVRGEDRDSSHQQAIIVGADDTPYAGGCFLFEIVYPDQFPQSPPKMNILTTAGNSLRFNPNLYDSGYVCLSLLGTWSGSPEESWNPSVSTVMHILMSIQSIVMSEDVIYQEPCYNCPSYKANEEVVRMNNGYKNIVKFGNVKYAMNAMLESPPLGFEDVIRAHFYLNKKKILANVGAWLEEARTQTEVSYGGLVHSHNHELCTTLASSPTKYAELLAVEVEKLRQKLDELTYMQFYRVPFVREEHIRLNEGKKYNDQITHPDEAPRIRFELTNAQKLHQLKKLKKKQRLGKW